jgi:hypothetical protein
MTHGAIVVSCPLPPAGEGSSVLPPQGEGYIPKIKNPSSIRGRVRFPPRKQTRDGDNWFSCSFCQPELRISLPPSSSCYKAPVLALVPQEPLGSRN